MARARPASRPSVGRERALLIVIVGVAAVLRLVEAARTPLWFDEIYVLRVARLPLDAVLALVARDIHPPLAFALSHAWQSLAGEHPLALKAFPILVSLATVLLGARLAGRIAGTGAALLAGVLLAVHVNHVQVSQMYDVYALIAFFTTALANLAWEALAPRGSAPGRSPGGASWRTWLLLAATGVLALYTHYLESPVMVTVILAGLVLAPAGEHRRWLALAVVLALAFVPQMPVFAEQFRREGSGSFFDWITLGQTFEVARRAAFGEAFAVPLVLGLALLPLARPRMRRPALLVWALVLLPLAAQRALPLVSGRDFLAVIPLVMALAAAGAFALSGRAPVAAAALLLACAAWAWPRHEPFPQPIHLEQAARFIAARARPGDAIVNAETHGLLFFLEREGVRRPVLLLTGGDRAVHYSEGGLVIPDSVRVDPARWAALAPSRRWWGVRVDRAAVSRGVVTRAGAVGARRLTEAARSGPWRFGIVTVWSGEAGVPPPGGFPTGGSARGSGSGPPPADGRSRRAHRAG